MSIKKHWCFTVNNYTDDDIPSSLPDGCSYLVCGREVASTGTKHLQCFVSFIKKQKMSRVLSLWPRAHVTVARLLPNAHQYCKKDGDFVEFGIPPSGPGKRSDLEDFKEAVKNGLLNLDEIREKFSDVYARYPRFCHEYLNQHRPSPSVPEHSLYQWQDDLERDLSGQPSRRKIIFLVDPVGNSGKSYFADYYCAKYKDAQIIHPSQKKDMIYVFGTFPEPPRVLFYDCPRSKQEHILYDFLEELKNGRLLVSKYESRMHRFDPPHVIVMMNEEPDYNALSSDRYDVKYVVRDS